LLRVREASDTLRRQCSDAPRATGFDPLVKSRAARERSPSEWW